MEQMTSSREKFQTFLRTLLRCRPNLTGRTCNEPAQTFYTKGLDFMISEAEIGSNCSGVSRMKLTNSVITGFTYTFAIFLDVHYRDKSTISGWLSSIVDRARLRSFESTEYHRFPY